MQTGNQIFCKINVVSHFFFQLFFFSTEGMNSRGHKPRSQRRHTCLWKQKLCHHYLDLNANKSCLKSIPNSHFFLFFSFLFLFFTYLELKWQAQSYTLVGPWKSLPNSRPKNVQNLYPFSNQNGAKTLPDGAAHTYIALCYKGVPPSPRGFKLLKATRKGFEVTPGHQTRDLSHRRHQGPRNNQLYQILAP